MRGIIAKPFRLSVFFQTVIRKPAERPGWLVSAGWRKASGFKDVSYRLVGNSSVQKTADTKAGFQQLFDHRFSSRRSRFRGSGELF